MKLTTLGRQVTRRSTKRESLFRNVLKEGNVNRVRNDALNKNRLHKLLMQLTFAKPKSINLGYPNVSIMIFSGFKSVWSEW